MSAESKAHIIKMVSPFSIPAKQLAAQEQLMRSFSFSEGIIRAWDV